MLIKHQQSEVRKAMRLNRKMKAMVRKRPVRRRRAANASPCCPAVGWIYTQGARTYPAVTRDRGAWLSGREVTHTAGNRAGRHPPSPSQLYAACDTVPPTHFYSPSATWSLSE